MKQSYGGDTMATVTVRRKPSYAELEAKVKELEDALVIAEKNKCLRDIGWDMLHNQIAELQRENRGLRVDLSNARKLNEELSDQVEADEREIADLKASREILREFREELGQEVDEANRVIAEMATELTELKADRNIALAEIERLKGELAQKNKINDTSFKATNELAELLVAAQRERDEAREEAGNYHVELMDRDCRVAELEKQVEWLRDKNEEWAQVANDQKATIVNYEAVIESLREEVERWKRIAAENVDLAKQFHHEALKAEEEAKRIKEAYDTLYERSADNYANAQYWEEQAHKLEEEIDTLQRQLKANEESYMALRAMYEELRDAATGLVSHIRTNTFAN
jgi:chromosome segregation ATPase